MAAEVRVEGADRLVRTLGAASRDLQQLDAPAQDAAVALVRDATRRAPRLTGALAASGQATRGLVSFGSSNVRYAGPINFGVGPRSGLRGPHNIQPTRFFSDAVEALTADITDTYYAPAVERVLDQVRGA